MLYAILLLAACCVLAAYAVPKLPRFGTLPEGERLARIQRSPHYRGDAFHNLEPTPSFTGEGGQFAALAEYFFAPKQRLKPAAPLPVIATDLKALDPRIDLIVWLGHSSFYLQLDGKRILVDPVFGDHASPFSFSTKAFPGNYPYSAASMPPIDLLLITHDHWDHLEHPTLLALKGTIARIVCPLGVGAHLERWGYAEDTIVEGDWFDTLTMGDLRMHFTPARHFSGRTLVRNKSLWTGFVLESGKRRIYISGDGGYGRHFTAAAERFNGFDLAILENGQYDKNWQYVHMAPEETAAAAVDLRAKAVLPVHNSRFSIANHTWDDPLIRLHKASVYKSYRLLTPVIGQVIPLDAENQTFDDWWEGRE